MESDFNIITCFSSQDVCKTLWCYTGDRRCETKHLPAAEGSSCGVKRVIECACVNLQLNARTHPHARTQPTCVYYDAARSFRRSYRLHQINDTRFRCLQWCRKGTCVLHGSSGPAPIDGGWSEFSSWSQCSRTCGGGIAFKERLCNKPR
jgi:ADAM cysteine-rich domain/Thrombospondin type 1 domain